MERNYNQVFSNRTKILSINIINELSGLPYSDKVSVIRKQIFRSSTSTAANYRAMCRARSEKEKYAKLCIVVEEADETLFWLELIRDLQIMESDKIQYLMTETEEIVKVTASYKVKLGQNINK